MSGTKKTRLPDLDQSHGYQLWRANNAMQRILRRVLDPLGLTPVQFIVLAAIGRLEDAGALVTQIEVCRFGDLDENMVSQVVRGLERRHLLERHVCMEDRRAYVLSLTDAGEEMICGARAVVRKRMAQIFDWPDGEAVLPLLRSLAERLEATEE